MPNQTIIEQLTPEQWALEAVSDFPVPWTSDAAKQPGGKLYSICFAMAKTLYDLNAQVVYAFNATRIQTATDVALDNAAKDFYGDQLPRLPGETDVDYRIRIRAGFFIPYTTRQSFITALTQLLGAPPRLISPWLPQDTSAYDYSYYDVDIPGMPGLYGAPGESVPYQVGLIATLPPTHIQTFGILLGYDMGAAYDYSSGAYCEAKANLFFGPNQVDALIKRIKAAGITVWRKYLNQSLITYLIANSRHVSIGTFEFPSSILPVAGPYCVVISGNWNAAFYVPSINAGGFVGAANTPAPLGGVINTLIVPFTVSGSGVQYLPVGTEHLVIAAPAGNNNARLAITPSWPTPVFITDVSSGLLTVTFGVPAPDGGNCGWVFMPDTTSARIEISEGAFGCTFPAASNSVKPFCTPSWNTQVAVEITAGIIHASFNVAAPAGAFVHIGYFTGHDNLHHNSPAPSPPPPIPGPFAPPANVTYSSYWGPNDTESSGSILCTADGSTLFVTPYTPSFTDAAVLKINTATAAITQTLTFNDAEPSAVFLTPDENHLIVVFVPFSVGTDQIYVLNAADLSIDHTIAVGLSLFHYTLSHDGATIIARNISGNRVYVIDVATGAQINFPVTSGGALAFSADDATIFAAVGQSIDQYDLTGVLLNNIASGLVAPATIRQLKVHPTSGIIFGFGFNSSSGNGTFFAIDPVTEVILGSVTDPSFFAVVLAVDPTNISGTSYMLFCDDFSSVWNFTENGSFSQGLFDITNTVGMDGCTLDPVNQIVFTTSQDNATVELVIQTIAKP